MTLTADPPAAPTGPTGAVPHGVAERRSLFDREILVQAVAGAFKKLDPRIELRNPVMFVVYVGTIVCLFYCVTQPSTFVISITIWLALTVLFANFAEAMAEGRGKAQAATLRK